MLLALHVTEMVVWAAALVYSNLVADWRSAGFFAGNTYTTVGYGDFILPNGWRMLAPIIAMSGLFTFGWSGSVLVDFVQRINKIRDAAGAASARHTEHALVLRRAHVCDHGGRHIGLRGVAPARADVVGDVRDLLVGQLVLEGRHRDESAAGRNAGIDDLEDVGGIARDDDAVAGEWREHAGQAAAERLVTAAAVVHVERGAARARGVDRLASGAQPRFRRNAT